MNIDPGDGRIVVRDLTKTYAGTHVVDRLSFTVEPGCITGFLGPNGAGKTTTLRMALGLTRPSSGVVTVNGVPYAQLREPLRTVGAAMEANCFHPARTGRNHLRVLCAAAELPDRRADEVLDLVGLSAAARLKVRHYSLGMRQRLAIATALLGDPRILILDEPTNGLDPEGIRWLRTLLRHLVDQGRTVLISSHQLGEMQDVADRVVIINRGQLVRAGGLHELTSDTDRVIVHSPDAARLAAALGGRHVERPDRSTLRVHNVAAAQVGQLALREGIELHQLRDEPFDLEELFFALTSGEHTGQEPR